MSRLDMEGIDPAWLDVWKGTPDTERVKVADHLVTYGVAILTRGGTVLDPSQHSLYPKSSGVCLVFTARCQAADARPVRL